MDGAPMFFEESALIELLAVGVLAMSGGYESPSNTIELFVLCNDVFYWGSADGEDCRPDELQGLYDAWLKDKEWGATIWCCVHRHLQPQKPVRKKMEEAGVWTEVLAALPEPAPS